MLCAKCCETAPLDIEYTHSACLKVRNSNDPSVMLLASLNSIVVCAVDFGEQTN